MLSSVTSAMRRQRPEPVSFLRKPRPTTTPGKFGPTVATISLSTLGLQEQPTPSYSYKFLSNAIAQASLPPRGKPVKSRTVEGALRVVGQAFTSVGALDPRLTPRDSTEFRLRRQLRGYSKADPAPNRVKPVPIGVIYHAANISKQHGTVESLAVINMICLAFFFLCPLGEYTKPTGNNAPFCLEDVTLYVGNCRFLAPLATEDNLNCVIFVTLTFTTQKNAVRGKVIGLGLSGDPFICPVRSIASRVRHL
jgi:hypothetical protein